MRIQQSRNRGYGPTYHEQFLAAGEQTGLCGPACAGSPISSYDATRTRFAEECRRQSAIVAATDLADRDLTDFMDSALEDMQRPNE